MTARRRQIGVLAVVLVVLAAVTWWQFGAGQEPSPGAAPRAGAARVPPQGPPAPAAGSATPLPRVELALLERPPAEPIDTGRDPFRFGSRRAAPEPAGSDTPGGARVPGAAAQAGPAGSGGPAVPAGPPPPPPIPLKFIGIVQKQGESTRIAVLSDGRGVYHGREGDVIEGRYRIVRIGNDSVEMVYLDGRGRQVIRLSGA